MAGRISKLAAVLCILSIYTCNPFVFLIPATVSSASRSKSETKPPLFLRQIDGKTAIRGDRYYATNSTIPHASVVSAELGVKPPLEASKRAWKRAWKIHKRALPILHVLDRCKPSNSKLNLACIWWKALSGNDPSSPVFDNGLSHDFLPAKSRFVVNRLFRRFYPRLHHANVEIRTAYLDQAVVGAISDSKQRAHQRNETAFAKFRLISMGAGYDVRSIKFLQRGDIFEAYELDLPEVVDTKARLFNRAKKRRRNIRDENIPKAIGIDLNMVNDVRDALMNILGDDDENVHTIILFEAVMIYLDEGVPTSLLKICADALKPLEENGSFSSLVFADRLENIPGGDFDAGKQVLESAGWKIVDWLPKPGLARHMGRLVLM